MRNIKDVAREIRTLIGDDKINEALRLLAFSLEEFNLPKEYLTDFTLLKLAYTELDKKIRIIGHPTNEILSQKNGKIKDILDFVNRVQEWQEEHGSDADIKSTLAGKAPKRMVGENVVQATEISKTLDQFQLKPITVEMETGKIIVVFGENGSGKSTLLKILAGVWKHDAGGLHYFQKPEVDDWYVLKKQIGYIPQEVPNKNLDLRDLLVLSCVTHGISPEEVEFYIQDVLTKLSLEDEIGKSWEELSGGFKMRFELARTIVWRPKILILDEPLANLDIITQRKFLHDIVAYSRSVTNPISIIITSQHIETVEEIADEIIFLSQGEVIFKDHPHKLKDVSLFKEADLEITPNDRNDEVIALLEDTYKEMIVRLDGNRIVIKTAKSLKLEEVLTFLFSKGFGIKYFKDNTTSARKLFQH